MVRCATGAGESSVAVPFADRWFDIDHDLLTITGDLDAMQIAMQESMSSSADMAPCSTSMQWLENELCTAVTRESSSNISRTVSKHTGQFAPRSWISVFTRTSSPHRPTRNGSRR
jgi:hypothetical protein